MSSNDQLVITKKEEDFCIHHNLCVDNDFRATKGNLIASRKTLKAAIKYAQKFINTYPYVEYGYSILDSCLREEK